MTENKKQEFINKCEDYLTSIRAMKSTLHETGWMLISIYGTLIIWRIDLHGGLYSIFMQVEYNQFVPNEEWMITKGNGKCNIHESSEEEAFNIFQTFIERVKSPVHSKKVEVSIPDIYILNFIREHHGYHTNEYLKGQFGDNTTCAIFAAILKFNEGNITFDQLIDIFKKDDPDGYNLMLSQYEEKQK